MGFPLLDLFEIGKTLIEKLIPDPKAKAEALQKLAELQMSGDLQVIAGQVEINKIEAASDDKFKSRARPFIMWVCGVALAYALVLSPIIAGMALLFGKIIVMPVVSTELLTTLLIGMLGLGGMRTVEKLQGRQ